MVVPVKTQPLETSLSILLVSRRNESHDIKGWISLQIVRVEVTCLETRADDRVMTQRLPDLLRLHRKNIQLASIRLVDTHRFHIIQSSGSSIHEVRSLRRITYQNAVI